MLHSLIRQTSCLFLALGLFPQVLPAEALGAIENSSLNGRRIYQQAYVKATTPEAEDFFGEALAFTENTLVVGAPQEDGGTLGTGGADTDNSLPDSGAAYVYVREGGDWRFDAYLKPTVSQMGAEFGAAVAIDGDIIVVGAPGLGGGSSIGNDTGAAFYYFRSQHGWDAKGMLTAFDGQPGDRFGASVAVRSPTVLVGAPTGDGVGPLGSDSGAAYLFAKVGVSSGEPLLGENTEAEDRFGETVAFVGGRAVVGAPGEDSGSSGVGGNPHDNSMTNSGAVYVFRKESTWVQEAYIKASNPDPGDFFGESLAASDLYIVAGTPHEESSASGVDGDQDDNSLDDVGAAYVFGESQGSWTQEAYLKPSNPLQSSDFAYSVAAHGEVVAVGARDANSFFPPGGGVASSGAGYVFQRAGDRWNLVSAVRASNPRANDLFGVSTAIFGDTLVFGATGEDGQPQIPINGSQEDVLPGGRDSGAAYVLTGLFDR